MKTLLFSDVHLSVAPDGRDTMDRFIRFLDSLEPREFPRVVIVGDLFDFWFEYKAVIFSGYFDVLRALARYADAGCEIHFAVGNHDFWAGRFLRDRLNFQIHHEPFTLDFGDKQALVLHGDGINARDWPYRIYKRLARWRVMVRLFRAIHPDRAMAIAQGVSRGSRNLSREEDVSKGAEVAAQREFAEGVLRRGEADIVICGHSHFPILEKIETSTGNGIYVNTGDWLFRQSYVVWEDGRFTMKEFSFEAEDIDQAEIIA